jgi:glycosyltransferase involved in cell wall biosynthesis
MPRMSSLARPLKIVMVSPAYSPLVGGAERMLQSVSERLVERGHDVTVLTSDSKTMLDFTSLRGAGLPPSETLNGVNVIRVGPSTARLHEWHRWWLRRRGGWRTSAWLLGEDLWPLGVPSGLSMVLPLARIKADVIVSVNWHFGMSFWVCRSRRLRRVPRVAVPVLHIEREWANNPRYPRMFQDCDGVIVLTDAEREFVEARGGNAIAVAGVGVDPGRFARRDGAAIRARYGIADRPVVGFIGRQDAAKGVPTLIEAMRAVWEHFPDAVLLLAGQRAHREPAVAKMLAHPTAADRCRVVLIDDFAAEDAASIMDACDVLALPSVEEAFGLVMIEAWMCGKPVIGADIASTRCIIDSGVDGWTAKPFDATSLAERILDLLADPAKRAAFGERGRAKVLSRYNWDRVTDVWESTFQRAAAAQRSRALAADASITESGLA